MGDGCYAAVTSAKPTQPAEGAQPAKGTKSFLMNMKKVQLFLAVSLCVFGCILLACGFFCPPLAEIHHSVLIAFGEILTFSGSLIGIDYKYRYKE